LFLKNNNEPQHNHNEPQRANRVKKNNFIF